MSWDLGLGRLTSQDQIEVLVGPCFDNLKEVLALEGGFHHESVGFQVDL